jgi:beta-lactamase regulating signal transducer with metallopeptidase domain
MSDALAPLLQANLAAAAAVALVLALRLPARRLFGARIAYGLWVLVPLAALATLLPERVVTVRASVVASAQATPAIFESATPVMQAPASFDPWPLAVAVWIAGGLVSLAWLGWRQAQFGRAVREGRAGPAVVGVLRPRIVTPDDFERRYTPREQLVVLAHEEVHIARQDSRTNAVVAFVRCANWFNPLLHVLARYLRIDQELACDAQVVARHPTARRSYAEAMLKTQLAARPLPLGCYWPAPSLHPLAERISLLSRRTDRRDQRLGAAMVAALAFATVGSAWASKPPRVVVIEAPSHPQPVASARARDVRVAPATTRPSPAPETLVVGTIAPVAVPEADAATATAQALADALAAPAPIRGDIRSPEAPLAPQAPEPPRQAKVYAAARQSSVEHGWAVRVAATAVDPDGKPLSTDLTSYGSQNSYRTGAYRRDGSRYVLFTSVVQRGERLLVTASMNERSEPPVSGSISLGDGQSGDIVLPGGQVVHVAASVRPETAAEIAAGEAAARQRTAEREARDRERAARDRLRELRQARVVPQELPPY